jgi:hypothetical protein
MKLKFDKDVLKFIIAAIILAFISYNVYSGYVKEGEECADGSDCEAPLSCRRSVASVETPNNNLRIPNTCQRAD